MGVVARVARCVVDQCRGDVDVPIPIWDDLDDAGESGRIFYFYLFAICYDLACGFLSDGGCPSDVIDSTMTVVPRHVQIHERKRGVLASNRAGGYCRYCAARWCRWEASSFIA